MKKSGADPKVKKTFVRNCERKIRPTTHQHVMRDVNSSPEMYSAGSTLKEDVLSEPTLCSSTVLAKYLSEVKKSGPPPLSAEDLNVDKGELCAKMTKKLNFHFNDKIYRNLIKLNAGIEELKTKKDKRPSNATSSAKKDLEPSIDDFCEDEQEPDSPPKIPVIKPKLKTVKTVEGGHLHKLIASIEVL